VTVRPYTTVCEDDITPARMLCDALKIGHILLDSGGFKFTDEIRSLELTNFCADEHGWYLALADYFKEHHMAVSYDGIAGDVLSVGHWWKTGLADLYKKRSYSELSQGLFKYFLKPEEDVLRSILSKGFYEKTTADIAIAHLTQEIKKYIDSPNPMRNFYFWNRTRRVVALSSYGLGAGTCKVYSPFLDHELYDFLLSVPDEVKEEKTFHTETMRRSYPEYAGIPYQNEKFWSNSVELSRAQFINSFLKYYMKNYANSTAFLKTRYVLPRILKCFLPRHKTPWWIDPPGLLYLMELRKLQGAAGL